MDPKSVLARADKLMDPAGLILVVSAYFANKFWSLDLTADDVLIASLGAGAVRTLWEGHKRARKEPISNEGATPPPD